ncbi:MAG: Uncharacterized protein K0S04_1856 [Herbinix sp.]|jgi:hypothetical protein|nr:Uncharacterized protein [Herbinix sp.]
MSFQAYIDNITTKTGKTPEQIRDEAINQGVLTEDMKATVFTDWLKKEYQLGHGHAMAMWKYFIEREWINTKHSKM